MAPTSNRDGECQGADGGADAPRVVRVNINGKSYRVDPEVPKTTTLLSFIRNYAKLPGTKAVCEEGGCGACTVVATVRDLERRGTKSFSIQACQALVYACSRWRIETIEHLGNRYKGYDSLQTALHTFYGTQCGFCSPGIVMTMHGQMKSKGRLKAEEIDKVLDGNLCRCTGYRPIVDAYKSLAEDAPQHLKDRLTDIEDIHEALCPHTGEKCKGSCNPKDKSISPIPLSSDEDEEDLAIVDRDKPGAVWYRPRRLEVVYDILSKKDPRVKHRIVVGNTGQGVYKEDGPYNMYINTTGIKKLYRVSSTVPLVIGANVSLARMIEVFKISAKAWEGYQYLENLAQHWEGVANVAVRNAGSWAGNLMMKHQHNEFPSDIFITLFAVGTKITIADAAEGGQTSTITLEEFLKVDMERKLILSMTVPALPENTHVRSFKIAPRSVNAHAYVNAVFVLRVDSNDDFRILTRPTVVLGGINSTFIRAVETEKVLYGKRLMEKSLVSVAALALSNEIHPDSKPQDSSPAYRKELAQGLLFKTVLGIVGLKAGREMQSGGKDLERPPSFSKQEFDMNDDTWPVGKPVPKLESMYQLSGEAEYVNDIPAGHNELFGYFILTTVAKAKIKNIDISLAMRLEGVETFITAEDIPGPNTFVSTVGISPDPVFVDAKQVVYAGQAVGLIVADSHEKAKEAARLVKVEYEDIKKPVLTIKEALKNSNEEDGEEKNHICFGEKFGDVIGKSKHIIKGEMSQGSQYHFMMESLAARTVPTEEGYDVVATSQWLRETQTVIATALKVPLNRVHVKVRRLGGGFGAKISRGNIVAVASAVAAHVTHRPVRVVLDLNTNMNLMGWREPFYSQYQVGFDDAGNLEAVKGVIISDAGHVSNETSASVAAFRMANVYTAPAWHVFHRNVNTDTAANTWCRTPGTTQGVATMENIIEQVAAYLQKDPLEIREVNFAQPETPMFPKGAKMNTKEFFEVMTLLKKKATYVERRAEVEAFNKANRWKKRGISIVPLRYEHNFPPSMRYTVHVAIYNDDGTVCVSHGGIEMGQGINTKVAQVVAKVLGIHLNAVKIRASDTFISANSSVTGGSYGSDVCAHGAKMASEKLIARMNVQKEKMKEIFKKDPTWVELVQYCLRNDVDLSERYWTASSEHPNGYDIYAAACLEVEIDVLTGQYVMRRADIVEDCGRSVSPYVDIGQIEGAFVMGLGLYTCEMVKFDENTGRKVTNGTWDYKILTAMDVPADFRITLLPNPDNNIGVVRSKATGEPAVCMGYVAVTALRHAIASARADAGDHDWFNMDTPLTVEAIQQLCKVDPTKFSIYSKDTEKEDFEIVCSDEIPQIEVDNSCLLG